MSNVRAALPSGRLFGDTSIQVVAAATVPSSAAAPANAKKTNLDWCTRCPLARQERPPTGTHVRDGA
ncbi:hypothetical protein GCM10027610_086970 [Dactylosporangium cerinum]